MCHSGHALEKQMLNVIFTTGHKNVFTLQVAAVFKHGDKHGGIDMGKTIEHIQDILGKDATFKIV